MVLRFYTKNFKSFRPKMKAWRRFFRILISFLIGKINVIPSFLLKMTWTFLFIYVPQCYKKKFQVISIKNEGVTAIFPNLDFILNRENQRHGFIFAWNDSKLFV